MGYVPGLGLLGSVKEGYIPMAPSTVISFIVLGGILLAMTLRSLSGASLVLSGALAALVSVFGALEVAGYFIGRDLSLEDAVIPSAGYLGDIPIGRMSPSTAAAFFFAGLSTIALVLRNTARSRRTHLEHWAGCLGSLVLGISIIFCLAYLYGNPLMYGQGATVPMALTTTFGFLMLGTAAVSASGRDAIPVRLFAGPSTRSHLLRVFLPLTTLSTLVGGFVVLRAGMFSGLNPTLVSAATTVVTASITGFITIWVARRVASAITQSKVARDHAMASLRESEERYRAIAEDSPGLICRFLPGGEITFVNDAYCRYFEKTAEELAGSSFLSLIPEEDRETVMANIAALTVESPTDSIEHAAIAPGGEIRWQRWTRLALFDKEGKAAAYQAIGEDITERKQAQDALRESEERLRLMMQQSPSVIEVYDARGLQVDVNDAYEALWGFPADHTVNQFNVLKSRQVEATGLLEYVKRAYTGETVKVPEYAFDSRGETEGRGRGRIRWLNTRIYPLKDGDGSVHHIVLTHEDITDRKRAEEGLHRLDRQLRTGIDQMPMAYILWDRKFRAIEWNASAERIFGYSKAELVGKHPLDYIVPDAVRPMVHEVIEDLLAGKVASYSEEGNNIRKDGSVISCQWYNTPLKDETGATFAVLSMVIDITDRRRAEEERRELEAQLRQSQKMEAVGQLAGGVAHDFNNILTTILVNVELSIGSVRSELGADHRVAECMEEIEKAAQRASVLTRQLLTFSRRAVMQPEVLNLNRILADLDKMLQRLITEDITLDTVTDPNLQSVRADAGQLEQVIVNLVVN
ncbi:MAG: PAS domain S-box protein, partial [Candidatus Hydrogenedentes bacterium]|nr:PAS domain S-box protein [Candidatus Hydrogenedentota bacterium]